MTNERAEQETVALEVRDGVAWVKFNRPEKRNSMSPKLNRQMMRVIEDLEFRDDVGMDLERAGRVYVIPVPGRTVNGDEILDHSRQRLAKFKIPKTAVITDTLPRTASGKLQKHILKARAMREIAAE